MKKILLIAGLMTGVLFCANAQNYTRNGKEFSAVAKTSEKSEGVKTGYTWKDSKGNAYDIYISKSGACYTIRTSKKTGKEYRAYLPKEASAEIAHELGYEKRSED